MAISNATARAMTSPTFVRWLARQTNAPTGLLRGQINWLVQKTNQDEDNDAADVAGLLHAVVNQQ